MSVIAYELRCVGTPACLDVVQDALGELWAAAEQGSAEVEGIDRMLFETALVEILGNIVEHARTPEGSPVEVGVHLAVHSDRVEARLRDNGVEPPVDPGAAGLPEDELAEDGRGLALAAAVAQLAHTREGDRNVWTVIRHRGQV